MYSLWTGPHMNCLLFEDRHCPELQMEGNKGNKVKVRFEHKARHPRSCLSQQWWITTATISQVQVRRTNDTQYLPWLSQQEICSKCQHSEDSLWAVFEFKCECAPGLIVGLTSWRHQMYLVAGLEKKLRKGLKSMIFLLLLFKSCFREKNKQRKTKNFYPVQSVPNKRTDNGPLLH